MRTFTQRVYTTVPRHWKTATFISTLCPDGVAAPFMLDDPITANGSSPMSKKHFPGDMVLIDNLASHKGLRTAKAIETIVAERSAEALATSCAFKRGVQQISDQCCNQTSSAHHDK
jgi:hypothetical protein